MMCFHSYSNVLVYVCVHACFYVESLSMQARVIIILISFQRNMDVSLFENVSGFGYAVAAVIAKLQV